jgi:2-C-methyl-D-erythritol 4-phosphate cytidylyltransferase
VKNRVSPARRTVAVIYAGGQPDRGEPGLLAPLADRPIVAHSLAAFTAAPGVGEVLLIAGPALADRIDEVLQAADPVLARRIDDPALRIAEAGETRARSISSALQALTAEHDDGCDVLIHDADRPLVAPHVVADCLAALADSEAVCAAVPASDTMVAVENDLITGRPPRDRLRRRQYPQGFRLPVISCGYQLALADPDFRQADDCAVVLRYLPGIPVRLVPGSEQGFRVVSQADLGIAETLLRTVLP